jgi:hypothetical protein
MAAAASAPPPPPGGDGGDDLDPGRDALGPGGGGGDGLVDEWGQCLVCGLGYGYCSCTHPRLCNRCSSGSGGYCYSHLCALSLVCMEIIVSQGTTSVAAFSCYTYLSICYSVVYICFIYVVLVY